MDISKLLNNPQIFYEKSNNELDGESFDNKSNSDIHIDIDDILRISSILSKKYSKFFKPRMGDIDDCRSIACMAILEKNPEDNGLAYVIGKHAIFAYLRKNNREIRSGKEGVATITMHANDEGDNNIFVLDALVDKEGQRWLNDMMIIDELNVIMSQEEFPPSEASVLEGFLRGYSPKDIADEFKISEKTAMSHLTKAIKRIRSSVGIKSYLPIRLQQDKNSIEWYKNKSKDNKCPTEVLKGGLDISNLNLDIKKEIKKESKYDKINEVMNEKFSKEFAKLKEKANKKHEDKNK